MRSLAIPDFCHSTRRVRQLLPWLGALLMSVAAAQGVVQPVKQSIISAQASGRIATLLVKAGDKVRAGQVLATIDDREAQTGVQSSQAQVAQAQAGLHNAQANFDRTRDLRAKGFVSACLLYTSDAADDLLCVDLGGRRIIKKKKNK